MAAEKIDLATVDIGSLVSDVDEGVTVLTDALEVAEKFEGILPSGIDAAINAALSVLTGLQSVLSKV